MPFVTQWFTNFLLSRELRLMCNFCRSAEAARLPERLIAGIGAAAEDEEQV
jgi:hypothetical protein